VINIGGSPDSLTIGHGLNSIVSARESPIQWIAFSRIVLLWVFIVACTISSKGKLWICRFVRVRDGYLPKKGLRHIFRR
jgi:hypothetical protein